MCFSSSDGGAAERARAEEEARQGRIKQGTAAINEKFGEFGDEFYAKRKQEFADFANPDAQRQFKDAQGGVLYGLARSGNLASSERARQLGVVDRERDAAAMRIADKGAEYANNARTQVENNRTDLINQVQATGDATLAANQAMNRAATLRPSPAFEGLGSLFENSGNIIKAGRQAEYYNPGAPGVGALFGKGGKSVSYGK
jgi:hypothetical protein